MEININSPAGAGGGGGSNAAAGLTGATAPTSASNTGFVDGSGNLQQLTGTTANGPIFEVKASALPTGASTSALQTTGNTSLASILTAVQAATPAGTNVIGKVSIDQTTPGTTNLVSAAQGTPGTAANAWFVKHTDGTNTGAVKAASTAPAATDPAIVVTVSPNSADPAIGPVSAGTAATKSYLIGGVFNTSLPTLTTTQQASIQLDSSGRVIIRPLTSSDVVSAVQSGTWTVQPGNTANTTPWLTTQITSASSAVTSVASSATTVSLLASNTSRKNATFYNDSTQVLYLKLGATASTTSYTVQIAAGGYYELPTYKIYTGAIDGIWASANGNARITELT